jgi:hypothetical protein
VPVERAARADRTFGIHEGRPNPQVISVVLALARTSGAGAVVIEDVHFVVQLKEGRERSKHRASRAKPAKAFRRLFQMAANNVWW